MFKDEAIKEAIRCNLRRCKSAESILRFVKRELRYKAKHSDYHDDKGFVQLGIRERISQEGFTELKKMCEQEGIVFSSNWESPFPAVYSFKMKVR